MTAAVFMLRCGKCRRERRFTGTLDQARRQVCGTCSVHSHYEYRMTVVGHEDGETTMIDLAHAPGIERVGVFMTEDQRERADVLISSALEGIR